MGLKGNISFKMDNFQFPMIVSVTLSNTQCQTLDERVLNH